MIRSYKGAVAIITGGASGIGRAIGEALASRGADVVLADLQSELAEEVASGIREAGGKATAAALDVRDFAAFDGLVREVASSRGRLDYLFNNAGIGIGGRVQFYEVENWDRVIDVNIRGVTNGVQAAYSTMLQVRVSATRSTQRQWLRSCRRRGWPATGCRNTLSSGSRRRCGQKPQAPGSGSAFFARV